MTFTLLLIPVLLCALLTVFFVYVFCIIISTLRILVLFNIVVVEPLHYCLFLCYIHVFILLSVLLRCQDPQEDRP